MNRDDWDLQYIENIYFHVNKPIICAVNGICFGGGFELALTGDIIIASEKAQIALPEIKLGLFPGAGGTQRMVRQIGYYKASEYILTGKAIDLAFAKENNIINQIVKHEDLLPAALRQAEEIAKMSLDALITAKKSMRMALDTNLFAGLKAERTLFHGLFNTQDFKIGINSVLNKTEVKFIDK
jgi:enoyl-CoA hydratase/carnithine racemase